MKMLFSKQFRVVSILILRQTHDCVCLTMQNTGWPSPCFKINLPLSACIWLHLTVSDYPTESFWPGRIQADPHHPLGTICLSKTLPPMETFSTVVKDTRYQCHSLILSQNPENKTATKQKLEYMTMRKEMNSTKSAFKDSMHDPSWEEQAHLGKPLSYTCLTNQYISG